MKFGWINVFGAGIVVLLLIPNIVNAVRNPGEENRCTNRFMNMIEQIGRYACIILMWLPLLVWKFGFAGVAQMLLYTAGNGVLIAAYWFVFAEYLKEKNTGRALILAVLPACIFFLSGLLLRHWLLAGFALLFAAGHVYVTFQNTGKDPGMAGREQEAGPEREN